MGTGPKAKGGFDLALTEISEKGRHVFLLEVGSVRGEGILAKLGCDAAADKDVTAANDLVKKAAKSMGREMVADVGAAAEAESRTPSVGRSGQAVPLLRQLHLRLSDLLLQHGRGRHRSDRLQCREMAALGFLFHHGFQLHPRRQRAPRKPMRAIASG